MSVEERLKELEARVVAIENVVFETEKPPEVDIYELTEGLPQDLAGYLKFYDADGETRVKCTTYLHRREDWITINNHLKERGFTWESAGKNSYWHKRR